MPSPQCHSVLWKWRHADLRLINILYLPTTCLSLHKLPNHTVTVHACSWVCFVHHSSRYRHLLLDNSFKRANYKDKQVPPDSYLFQHFNFHIRFIVVKSDLFKCFVKPGCLRYLPAVTCGYPNSPCEPNETTPASSSLQIRLCTKQGGLYRANGAVDVRCLAECKQHLNDEHAVSTVWHTGGRCTGQVDSGLFSHRGAVNHQQVSVAPSIDWWEVGNIRETDNTLLLWGSHL